MVTNDNRTTFGELFQQNTLIMRAIFDELSDKSRIWIFQSGQPLIGKAEQITQEADAFLQQWAAHGSQLKASCHVAYNHFLIIAIDEDFNMASGCSIDSMTRFVQELAKKHDVELFDRTKLAFNKEGEIVLVEMNKMKTLVAEGFFTSETLFFNNNIQTKAQLNSEWLVKPEESWLNRYFAVAKSV